MTAPRSDEIDDPTTSVIEDMAEADAREYAEHVSIGQWDDIPEASLARVEAAIGRRLTSDERDIYVAAFNAVCAWCAEQ